MKRKRSERGDATPPEDAPEFEGETVPEGTGTAEPSPTPGKGGDGSGATPGMEDAETTRVRAERDDYLDKLRRLKADFENYRKRVERDRVEWGRNAVQDFVAGLLPLVDDFERALAASKDADGETSLYQGVRMIHADLLKRLHSQGVVAIDPVGKPFDPAFHDALLEEETDETPDRTVLESLRTGYLFHGRILRPAQVKISRTTAPKGNTDRTDPERAGSPEGSH